MDKIRSDIRGPIYLEALALEEQGEKVLKLNTGNPASFGFTMPDSVRQALVENVDKAVAYCDLRGMPTARHAILDYHTAKGIQGLTMDDIFVGNGVSELAEMAGLLGKTLRYGLSEHETVSVRREMRNLMDYIALQSLHYQPHITAHVSVEPEILDCVILKLLLQPLVENAIVHGVGPCERGGSVELMGYRDGDALVFAVSDDGAGMDAQKLALLMGYIRGENNAFSSIGLRNAHRRIELYYGEGYGLDIASQEGAGTVVTVRVPAVRQEEGEVAHEDSDCGR